MKNNHVGFTLIELLVVMSILSLLVVALLPMLATGQTEANKTADAANLRWHFQGFTAYKIQYRYPPRRGGSQFIIDPWVRRIVPRTKDSIDRYFSPTQAGDERWRELKEETELKDVWRDLDDITSEDTSYAGRARAHKKGMERSEQAWMASDNEGMNHYEDGTIMVLMSDGIVRRLKRDPDLIDHGWPEGEDDQDFVYPVGPESPHPLLRKLDK
jgi:prepilin-type N-terminal cleavage/methylation domain-containing protein